ncbi:MAG: hypothetical protein Q7P63_04520 [Verrucomicrobiota bacterium JB022]|nr:hypothetical protein [Verrucomicrobiota bacterium JB022]
MNTLPTALALAAAFILPSALSAQFKLTDTITMTGGTLVIESAFPWQVSYIACNVIDITDDYVGTIYSSWDAASNGNILMISGVEPDPLSTEVWPYLGYATIYYPYIPEGTYRVEVTTSWPGNDSLDLYEQN